MVRLDTEAESPAGNGGIPAHATDADCAPHLNEHGECAVCGVVAGDPCRYCGQGSFHASDCPTMLEAPDWVWPPDEAPLICRSCKHVGFTFQIREEGPGTFCPVCGSGESEEVVR